MSEGPGQCGGRYCGNRRFRSGPRASVGDTPGRSVSPIVWCRSQPAPSSWVI